MSSNFTLFIVANHIQSFFVLIFHKRVSYARFLKKQLDQPTSVKIDQ